MSVSAEPLPLPATAMNPAPPLLELQDVHKQFENGLVALRDVNLSIARGEFVSLLGASGCGKSTVLKLVAGLAKPTSGSICWSQSARPRLSYVFQEPTLMPWATALANVMLPLSLAGVGKKEAKAQAEDALDAVGLKKFCDAYPRQLSGGMKMRVSLARAIITQPEILLLDEPFAALDEITRFKLNNDLARLWRTRGFTAVFVTHSVFEAVYLAERVVVMAASPGRIFADCPVTTEGERTETFRTSTGYIEQCAALSKKLREAIT